MKKILLTLSIIFLFCASNASAIGSLPAKAAALQMYTACENNQVTPLFTYAENINDGRGITFGFIGFTTGTYDGNILIHHYTELNPNNNLAKYIPALDAIDNGPHNDDADNDGNNAVTGLNNFIPDVQSCTDPLFAQAQIDLWNSMYWDNAVRQANAIGAQYEITVAVLHDANGRHGDDGSQSLIDQTTSALGGTPKTGVNEITWLNKFIQIRDAKLASEHLGDEARQSGYKQVIASGNYNMVTPYQDDAYNDGDVYTIDGIIGVDLGGGVGLGGSGGSGGSGGTGGGTSGGNTTYKQGAWFNGGIYDDVVTYSPTYTSTAANYVGGNGAILDIVAACEYTDPFVSYIPFPVTTPKTGMQYDPVDKLTPYLAMAHASGQRIILNLQPYPANPIDVIDTVCSKCQLYSADIEGVAIDLEWTSADYENNPRPCTNSERDAWIAEIHKYFPNAKLFIIGFEDNVNLYPTDSPDMVFMCDSLGESQTTILATYAALASHYTNYGLYTGYAENTPTRVVSDSQLMAAVPGTQYLMHGEYDPWETPIALDMGGGTGTGGAGGSTTIAGFTQDTTNGTFPLAVQFTDQSTKTPTSWLWQFGDGTSATSQNPGHTYTQCGVFTVSLTAHNAAGGNTITKNALIRVNPIANFTGSPIGGETPLSTHFTDRSTGSPTAWTWNFGDGYASNAQNPTHIYQTAGLYTISLTASKGGASATKTLTNYVNATTALNFSDFTASVVTGSAPLAVDFTDRSTHSPTSWHWDFGDGTTSTSQNPSHTYNTEGLFTVTLSATNTEGTSVRIKQNIIGIGAFNQKNRAASNVSTNKGDLPLAVNFVDLSTGPVASWLWNFGDGQTSTLQNPSHTYAADGIYSTTLTVYDSTGIATKAPPVLVYAGNASKMYAPNNYSDAAQKMITRRTTMWDLPQSVAAVYTNYIPSDLFFIIIIIIIFVPLYIRTGSTFLPCILYCFLGGFLAFYMPNYAGNMAFYCLALGLTGVGYKLFISD